VGEIAFLHPFPLLLVTANSGELILLSLAAETSLGAGAGAGGWSGPSNRIYRASQQLSKRHR
jgi:hypothetical protein